MIWLLRQGDAGQGCGTGLGYCPSEEPSEEGRVWTTGEEGYWVPPKCAQSGNSCLQSVFHAMRLGPRPPVNREREKKCKQNPNRSTCRGVMYGRGHQENSSQLPTQQMHAPLPLHNVVAVQSRKTTRLSGVVFPPQRMRPTLIIQEMGHAVMIFF